MSRSVFAGVTFWKSGRQRRKKRDNLTADPDPDNGAEKPSTAATKNIPSIQREMLINVIGK